MLISCPSCAASYDVPDHLLAGAGQALRCARCQHEWVATTAPPGPAVAPPAPAPVAPATPVPAPQIHRPSSPDPPDLTMAAPQRQDPRPAPAYNRRALLLAWGLTIVAIGLFGFAALHWRGQVMALWPPSQRAYGLIGLR